jgi:hypothetical protein
MSNVEIYESTWKLANRVHQTPFVPKAMQGKPEHVLACVLYGNELGLGPMQSLNSIHVIEGRAAASPELMRALVAKAGHRIDVTENTNDVCVMKGTRIDTGAEATVKWSLDDAKNANLTGKDNWKKYPRAMLVARATSELCRLLFPDVIAGLSYTPEEMESVASAEKATATYSRETQDADDTMEPRLSHVGAHGSPDHEVVGPEPEIKAEVPGPITDEPPLDPIQLVMEQFPGSELIDEVEFVDSKTPDERRQEIKKWGAWPRIRAVAIPLARAEGMTPPANVDELIANHVLYTMVQKQMGPK